MLQDSTKSYTTRHLAVYQTSDYKTWRETGALVARTNALAAVSNPSTKMSPKKERKTKLGALSNSSYRIANTQSPENSLSFSQSSRRTWFALGLGEQHDMRT